VYSTHPKSPYIPTRQAWQAHELTINILSHAYQSSYPEMKKFLYFQIVYK